MDKNVAERINKLWASIKTHPIVSFLVIIYAFVSPIVRIVDETQGVITVATAILWLFSAPANWILISLAIGYLFCDLWVPFIKSQYSAFMYRRRPDISGEAEFILAMPEPVSIDNIRPDQTRAIARLAVKNLTSQTIQQCRAQLVGFSRFFIDGADDIPLQWEKGASFVSIPPGVSNYIEVVQASRASGGLLFRTVATSRHLGYLGVQEDWCKIVLKITAIDPWFSRAIELAARAYSNFQIDLCFWNDRSRQRPNDKITNIQADDLGKRLESISIGGNLDITRKRFLAVMSTPETKLQMLHDIPACRLQEAIDRIEEKRRNQATISA